MQFTRDGEKTIKPYLKKHAELANIIEVRTTEMSLTDLQRAQADATSSVRALGISVASDINIYKNRVELYVARQIGVGLITLCKEEGYIYQVK